MSGLFKGPLPVLILAGAGFLIYKYVPFEQIVERFRQTGPISATVPAPVVLDESEVAVTASAGSGDRGDIPAAQAKDTPAGPDGVPEHPASGASDVGEPAGVPQPILVQAEPDALDGTRLAGVLGSGNGGTQLAGTVTGSTTGAGVETDTGSTAVSTEPNTRPAAIPSTAAPTIVASRDPVPVVVPKPVVKSRPAPPADKEVAAKKPAVVVAKVDRPAVPPEPVAAVVAPPPPAPGPTLRILVEAETHDRAGTDRYSPNEYAAMLRNELIGIAGGYLGDGHVSSADANLAFRDDLGDGRAGVDRLCARAGSERLLLADLSVPSAGFSTVDSAYWPEVVFTAINCRDGRLHKSQKIRLEPSRLDRFEYQQGFAARSQRFVASQAYFLRP